MLYSTFSETLSGVDTPFVKLLEELFKGVLLRVATEDRKASIIVSLSLI